MKLFRAFLLLLVWSAIYYLGGVFVSGDWNTSEWDPAAKFVTLIFVWLPGLIVCAIAYMETVIDDR
jgi:hypothetical protein